jgi:NitT/TauT family transport system ATP-binding protein
MQGVLHGGGISRPVPPTGSPTRCWRGCRGYDRAVPKVTIRDLTVGYAGRDGSLTALDRVSLAVEPGEFLCLVGPSGCGKSTLLRVVAGLIAPAGGTVEIHGERHGRPATAMVFQEHALLPWRTVLANVAFGPENRGVPRAERDAHARRMLDLVGLSRFAQAYPHQLSGGMKQRVGIARALANDPDVLLMDEPLAALDAQTRLILQEELLRIWTELGTTVIYVTHSLEEALLLGDRIVLLTARPGRVKGEYRVPFGRPRGLEARAAPGFGALVDRIWAELRDEVVRAADAERAAAGAERSAT